MRKNIVAGNWKMNTTVPEGVELAKAVNEAVANTNDIKCDVVIGVPFTHLTAVKQVIDINKVGLAAENCADHNSGAYTGEVSAPMVASTGANYVILGHSERRGYYNESNEMLKTKVDLALEAGLKVIFCCGESLEELARLKTLLRPKSASRSSISLPSSGATSLSPTSPSGPSAPVRLQPATKPRKCMLSFAASLPNSLDSKLPTTLPSSMVEAASQAMPLSSSQSPTLTAD